MRAGPAVIRVRGRAGRASSVVLAGALLAASSVPAAADGFRVVQGGPSIGNAGAGTAATAEDPTTVFHNPAGMTRLGTGGALQANVIDVGLRFRNDGTRGGTGLLLDGGDGHDAGEGRLVPGLFGVWRANDDWAFGLAVTAPFGLSTDYGDSWVGRYHATHSSLETLDVSPCAALRISDRLSVGAGLNFQWMRAQLESAVDFGTIAAHALGSGNAASLGLRPGQDDGRSVLEGDSFAVGANAGVLWQAAERTRLGLSFRTAMGHDLDGEARFVVPKDALRLRQAGYFGDTGASSDLDLPEVVSLGVVQDLGAATTLVAGVDWTRWSRFEELDVRLDDPRRRRYVEEANWQDTLRPAAGLVWRPDSVWTLRTGFAWDPSAVSDADRGPRAPDAPRFTAALGLGWRISERAALEVHYLHAWGKDVPIDRNGGWNVGRLTGEYTSSVDYLSLQLSIDF